MRNLAPFAISLLAWACGGNVVVDQPGSGGSGGTTSTTTGTTSGTTTTINPSPCASHGDCPGGVCIFSTGTCAPACGGFCESCSKGTTCDTCATSSCPKCNDCVAACKPITPGQCDDDDPCPKGQVCLWGSNVCAPGCDTDMDCGGFEFCAFCVTGSCCGCEDCVSACVGGE